MVLNRLFPQLIPWTLYNTGSGMGLLFFIKIIQFDKSLPIMKDKKKPMFPNEYNNDKWYNPKWHP